MTDFASYALASENKPDRCDCCYPLICKNTFLDVMIRWESWKRSTSWQNWSANHKMVSFCQKLTHNHENLKPTKCTFCARWYLLLLASLTVIGPKSLSNPAGPAATGLWCWCWEVLQVCIFICIWHCSWSDAKKLYDDRAIAFSLNFLN